MSNSSDKLSDSASTGTASPVSTPNTSSSSSSNCKANVSSTTTSSSSSSIWSPATTKSNTSLPDQQRSFQSSPVLSPCAAGNTQSYHAYMPSQTGSSQRYCGSNQDYAAYMNMSGLNGMQVNTHVPTHPTPEMLEFQDYHTQAANTSWGYGATMWEVNWVWLPAVLTVSFVSIQVWVTAFQEDALLSRRVRITGLALGHPIRRSIQEKKT